MQPGGKRPVLEYNLREKQELVIHLLNDEEGRSDSDGELRFLRMTCGSGGAGGISKVEICGAEVQNGTTITFPIGTSCGIYAKSRCVVTLEGNAGSSTTAIENQVYLSDHSTVPAISDVHTMLSTRRESARRKEMDSGHVQVGPVVLVTGAPSSGKSTCCTMLANYAARSGFSTVVIDLDVATNMLTVSESIAAVKVHANTQIHPEEGFTLFPVLSYFYGFSDVQRNVEHYKGLLEMLCTQIRSLTSTFAEFRWGGCIINAPKTASTAQPFLTDLYHDIIRIFDVSVVVSIGSDWIRHLVRKSCRKESQQLTTTSSSSSALDGAGTWTWNFNDTRVDFVSIDALHHTATYSSSGALYSSTQLRRYLRGTATTALVTTTTSNIPIRSLHLIKLGAVQMSADNDFLRSLLPIQEDGEDGILLERISFEVVTEVNKGLLNRVVAIVKLEGDDNDDADFDLDDDALHTRVRQENVLGYAYLSSVSEDRQEVSFMSPFQDGVPLGKEYFYLIGDVRYR
eukprot:PhF_6_TR26250/c0_g1_i2/m.37538/K14399/CLP1, HERB; polyribonucleotide 5'-hydroxyl-kinase